MKLVCWSCGAKREAPFLPSMRGFDLFEIADAAGMLCIFDGNRRRILIFCDELCMADQTTKSGVIRKFPKRVA